VVCEKLASTGPEECGNSCPKELFVRRTEGGKESGPVQRSRIKIEKKYWRFVIVCLGEKTVNRKEKKRGGQALDNHRGLNERIFKERKKKVFFLLEGSD